MTCPLCGQLHREGTDYCPVLLAKIPVQKPLGETTSQEDVKASKCEVAQRNELTTCANCGYIGIAGERCDQCGQVVSAGCTVIALMPNGIEIALPISEEIIIGRESSNYEVASALSHCDGVSRRHCSLLFDSQGKCATVADLESTNGTWIGCDKEPLMPNELFTGRLPIELHLGKHATISLREG